MKLNPRPVKWATFLCGLGRTYCICLPEWILSHFCSLTATHPKNTQEKGSLTLATLRDRYLDTHRNGSLEKSTLEGIELHFKHLAGTLGERFPVEDSRWLYGDNYFSGLTTIRIPG